MFAVLKRWLESRRKKSEVKQQELELLQSVWLAFEAKYPNRKILRNWRCKPQTVVDGSTVICIVWQSYTIPPARSWWSIVDSSQPPEELSYDEAKQLIDIPRWR